MTETDTDIDELQEQVSKQQQMIEALGEQIQEVGKTLPDQTRRRVLQAGGAAGLVALGAAGQAAAAPGDDGDTTWGTDQNRSDYYVDELDANSVSTPEADVTYGARWLQNKIVSTRGGEVQNVYDPADYADPVTAANAAIADLSGGGRVYLPETDTASTTTLSLNRGSIEVVGHGRNVRWTIDADPAVEMNGGGNYIQRTAIRNFRWEPSTLDGYDRGLFLQDVHDWIVEGCWINMYSRDVAFGTTGGTWNGRFLNNQIKCQDSDGNRAAGNLIDIQSGSTPNGVWFLGNEIHQIDGTGISINAAGHMLTFAFNLIESMDNNISIAGNDGDGSVNILHNYFEASGSGEMILINGSTDAGWEGTRIEGNRFGPSGNIASSGTNIFLDRAGECVIGPNWHNAETSKAVTMIGGDHAQNNEVYRQYGPGADTVGDVPGSQGNVSGGSARESASAEEPQRAYGSGVIVDFTDSGDGSGTGYYLTLPDGTFAQLS